MTEPVPAPTNFMPCGISATVRIISTLNADSTKKRGGGTTTNSFIQG